MSDAREAIRYFVPGPAYVLDETRAALTAPVAEHRAKEFRAVWDELSRLLPPVFRTTRFCCIATGSSTLAMESALVSFTARDTLHLVNGAFSERWLAIARSHGRAADELSVPWGEAVTPELLRAALRRKRYEAVTIVHCETSTGVLQPVAELARVVREESDALVLVDAVSSLGGAPVESDAWALDFVCTGSQKGLAAPPGLALFTFSGRAEERAGTIAHRGFYTDLLRYRDYQKDGGPITTPALAECRALLAQLRRIERETLEVRWARHARLAATTAAWADANRCAFASAEGVRSPTVSCLRPPPGVGAPELVKRMSARGFTLGGGYGKWKSETFRIGHMGEVDDHDLAALLAALTEELA